MFWFLGSCAQPRTLFSPCPEDPDDDVDDVGGVVELTQIQNDREARVILNSKGGVASVWSAPEEDALVIGDGHVLVRPRPGPAHGIVFCNPFQTSQMHYMQHRRPRKRSVTRRGRSASPWPQEWARVPGLAPQDATPSGLARAAASTGPQTRWPSWEDASRHVPAAAPNPQQPLESSPLPAQPTRPVPLAEEDEPPPLPPFWRPPPPTPMEGDEDVPPLEPAEPQPEPLPQPAVLPPQMQLPSEDFAAEFRARCSQGKKKRQPSWQRNGDWLLAQRAPASPQPYVMHPADPDMPPVEFTRPVPSPKAAPLAPGRDWNWRILTEEARAMQRKILHERTHGGLTEKDGGHVGGGHSAGP